LVVAIALSLTSPANAEPSFASDSYVKQLIAKSGALNLAQKTTWLRLGHYRSGTFSGYESEADGPAFFLAKDGKGDPKLELEATIEALFAKPVAGNDDGHAICRFPARLIWLDSELHFDRTLFPKVRCDAYFKYLEILRPEGLALVFSSYFLNSPASAFGHTFLRIKRAGYASGGVRHDLLDYGVDYSATVDTGNALLYAMKGLTGLFNGEFRRLPYYYKAREYNDYESRDLWEYDIALTHDEVLFVVSHLWELGSTYFDYYYLSENCSYHILALIEVARPDLDLLSKVSWPVIPVDTIKALYKNPGLVADVHYRPSNRSQFRRRVAGLSGDELSLVSALMSKPRSEFPKDMNEHDRVESLDAAIDLLDVRMSDDLGVDRSKELSADTLNQQVLLERRAELPIAGEEFKLEPPFREMPHIGHDSARMGMATGYDHRREGYYSLSFRLALHDLADPSPGYPDTSTIEFLPTRARYFFSDHAFQLQDLSIVRVSSLVPVDRFNWPLAFKFDVGAFRTYDSTCRSCLTPAVMVGGGSAFALGDFLLFYATADVNLALPMDEGLLDFFRFGIGPAAGLRLRFSERVAAVFTGSWSYLPGQHPKHYETATGQLRFGISRNVALGVEGEAHPKTQSMEAISYFYF
jgi:hypothetical protein